MANPDQQSAEPSTVRAAPTRYPTRRRWIFRLVTVGMTTMIGLAIIAVILMRQERLVIDPRTHWPKLQSPPIYLEEPGHELSGHRYLYDPQLGWRNIPNWKATSHGRRLTINSFGLRDREYTLEKPAGVSRLLVLGDSYAWGYGVQDDEIFTEVMEDRLTDKNWQVVNTGVSGWGTDQEYLFLTNEGFDYHPDVVLLLFFVFNDPINNINSMQYGLSKPVFSNLDLTLANTPVPRPNEGPVPLKSSMHPMEISNAIVTRIAKECEQHDCRFVVAKFGNLLFTDPKTPVADRDRLAQWSNMLRKHVADQKLGLFVDLDQEFIDHGVTLEQLLNGNHDDHWNAFGHRLVAEILELQLQTHGLLD